MSQPSLWIQRSFAWRTATWVNPASSAPERGLPFWPKFYMGFIQPTMLLLFTPLLAVYLYHKGRLLEFEKMALAVTLGYAVAYTSFALIPVWGPRWGLLREGLLEASEQKLRGYWITKGINCIMYQGIAHKGGAMPSAHSSTAVVFWVWCWWLWGPWGGVPAAFTVTGMWVGAVYCRYHYVLDIICGAVLGVASLWIVELAV